MTTKALSEEERERERDRIEMLEILADGPKDRDEIDKEYLASFIKAAREQFKDKDGLKDLMIRREIAVTIGTDKAQEHKTTIISKIKRWLFGWFYRKEPETYHLPKVISESIDKLILNHSGIIEAAKDVKTSDYHELVDLHEKHKG